MRLPLKRFTERFVPAFALVLITVATPLVARGQDATPVAFDPAAFQVGLTPVVSGLEQPMFMVDPADGSGRWFVVEQPGRIRVVQDGDLLPEPLLDLTGVVEAGGSEQGLLSMALHPDFATNGEFFVGYTANTGEGAGDNTIARYRVDPADPNRADPASGEVLLAIPDPYRNHNGGLVMFGPDGYLYAGLGDGGSGGDPQGNGQDPFALLGKILRLDVEATTGDRPYGIPAGNPFADGEAGAPEVWATGLRNPWRFSFDRGTGDLYIADVGQNQVEEVNFQPAASAGGENYGWNIMEGTNCFAVADCDPSGLVLPVAEYEHDQGCSVSGGYVYRGTALPALTGVYLFADYCTGLLWGLGRDASGAWLMSEPLATGLNIASFGENAAGELFALDPGGTIYQVTAVD